MTKQQRLDAVRRLKDLVPWDGPLRSVPTIAARLCGVPVGLITLIDDVRITVPARFGVDFEEFPLEPGLCQSATEDDAALLIEDAAKNARARNNSLVTGPFAARFYAGVPLHVLGGPMGTLCVLDHVPRSITKQQFLALECLAHLLAAHLDLHVRMSEAQGSLADELVQRELREEHVRGLNRELAHRSKNILAVVQSIIRQTTRDLPSNALVPLLHRIEGLGRTHDVIVDVEWQGVPLRHLAETHLTPFVANAAQVTIEGPEVSLTTPAAQHIGLALHELGSNAIKYGALSVPHGRVHLRWSIEGLGEDAMLHARWNETGGPAVVPPQRRGFGCLVLERVAPQSLDGEAQLNFNPQGVSWHMTCPAENAAVASVPNVRNV